MIVFCEVALSVIFLLVYAKCNFASGFIVNFQLNFSFCDSFCDKNFCLSLCTFMLSKIFVCTVLTA